MFSEPLAKIKNETTIKTSLRARGPPGVSGALRSVHILRIELLQLTSGNLHSDILAGNQESARVAVALVSTDVEQ